MHCGASPGGQGSTGTLDMMGRPARRDPRAREANLDRQALRERPGPRDRRVTPVHPGRVAPKASPVTRRLRLRPVRQQRLDRYQCRKGGDMNKVFLIKLAERVAKSFVGS